MKKLIIVLMMVAMASFLFVGCLPGTVTTDTTTDTTTTPTTVAPIITTVPDAANAYVNKAEAADGIVVNGTGPTYSEIKLYIDGIFAGTGDVTATGAWTVVVAKTDLGVDGAKVLYATATEAGLAESAKSNEIKFTLDTVVPSIKSSSAKVGTARVYSFVETTDSLAGVPGNSTPLFQEALIVAAGCILDAAGSTWVSIPLPPPAVSVGEQVISPFTCVPATNPLMAGIKNWKIEILLIDFVGDVTVRVTNLTDATSKDYTFVNAGTLSTSWIPGLQVALPLPVAALNPATDVGAYVLITTTNTPATFGYIDVTFNESVTGASILATTTVWTAFAATVNLAPAITVRSATVARLTEAAAGTMAVGQAYSVSVSGIIDLAGNPIPATAPSTSIGIVMP